MDFLKAGLAQLEKADDNAPPAAAAAPGGAPAEGAPPAGVDYGALASQAQGLLGGLGKAEGAGALLGALGGLGGGAAPAAPGGAPAGGEEGFSSVKSGATELYSTFSSGGGAAGVVAHKTELLQGASKLVDGMEDLLAKQKGNPQLGAAAGYISQASDILHKYGGVPDPDAAPAVPVPAPAAATPEAVKPAEGAPPPAATPPPADAAAEGIAKVQIGEPAADAPPPPQ